MPDAAPVRAGEELILEIGDLAFGGQGVARVAGFVVFVDRALAGERVRARVRRVSRGYAEADCLDILTPSPDRVTPPCRHYGVCGGCDLQHLSPRGQARSKGLQIGALLKRVAGIESPMVLETETPGDPTRYRFRIDFDWGAGAGGRAALGLHRAGRPSEIVPLETCHLVPEAANRIRALLAERAAQLRLEAWDPRRRRGLLRRAGIQMARATGEILLTLETGRGDPPALLELAASVVRAFPRVVGVARREFDRDDRFTADSILHGRDHLFEEIDGDRFRIPATSFFQPNATAWPALRRAVLDALAPVADQDVLELYCGVGFFTLPLARRCLRVTALDDSRESVAAARDNAARASLENVRFVCGDAARELPRLIGDGRLDAILVDPPRSGLPPGVSRLLAGAGARVVYVSCDPATLSRDLKVLLGGERLRLTSVVPLDLFPQTHHVECVALLDRITE